MEVILKKCTKCLKKLELSCFGVSQRYKGKEYKTSWCYKCHRAYNKEWIKKNRIKITSHVREKRRNNPKIRLSCNVSRKLNCWLKGEKKTEHWEYICKFTVEDLIRHLESKFRDGMTIDNYGKVWHVDHIKPLCLCNNLEEAWNLNNLQPLLVKENLTKNKKYGY